MIEAGIYDGDTVIIQRTETADSGTIVVALVDNEEVTLEEAAPARPIDRAGARQLGLRATHLRLDQVKVQGRLIGLLRRYRVSPAGAFPLPPEPRRRLLRLIAQPSGPNDPGTIAARVGDTLYPDLAIIEPDGVRSLPPQIETVDEGARRSARAANRHQADDHVGNTTIVEQRLAT